MFLFNSGLDWSEPSNYLWQKYHTLDISWRSWVYTKKICEFLCLTFTGSHSANSDQWIKTLSCPSLWTHKTLLFEITKIIGKRKPNTCSISHMNTVKRRSLNVKNKVKDQCPRCGWLLKKLLISNHILCLRSSDSEFGSVQWKSF